MQIPPPQEVLPWHVDAQMVLHPGLHEAQEFKRVVIATLHHGDVAFHVIVQGQQLCRAEALRRPFAYPLPGNVLVENIRNVFIAPYGPLRALLRLMYA